MGVDARILATADGFERIQWFPCLRYFDEDYPRGHWPTLRQKIMTLQDRFPEYQIYYLPDTLEIDPGPEHLFTEERLHHLDSVWLRHQGAVSMQPLGLEPTTGISFPTSSVKTHHLPECEWTFPCPWSETGKHSAEIEGLAARPGTFCWACGTDCICGALLDCERRIWQDPILAIAQKNGYTEALIDAREAVAKVQDGPKGQPYWIDREAALAAIDTLKEKP